MNNSLAIAFIQYDIKWEDPQSNFSLIEKLIADDNDQEDLIVLPEMFNTGFSMAASKLAEDYDGPTVAWMIEVARKYKCTIAGSIIFQSEGQYFNRFLFVDTHGVKNYYDKRHLYTPGSEDESYSAGERNVIIKMKGWKIMPQICYDLRFPAWSRNDLNDAYDLLIYVASWPSARIKHWDRLLAARAIENQSYCLGVNRIGKDGNDLHYSGSSAMYDFHGQAISEAGTKTGYFSVTIRPDHLSFRSKLNFLQDRDQYDIS